MASKAINMSYTIKRCLVLVAIPLSAVTNGGLIKEYCVLISLCSDTRTNLFVYFTPVS